MQCSVCVRSREMRGSLVEMDGVRTFFFFLRVKSERKKNTSQVPRCLATKPEFKIFEETLIHGLFKMETSGMSHLVRGGMKLKNLV